MADLIYLSAREKNAAESLTSRQLDIAQLYARGHTNKQIAQERALSPATVRNHLAQIYDVLQVHDKREMARKLEQLLKPTS